jgi:hypothetical protein
LPPILRRSHRNLRVYVERETGSYASSTKPRVEFTYRIATRPLPGDENSV